MIFIVCNSLRNSRIYCCKRAYCKNAPQVLTKIIQYNSSYSLFNLFWCGLRILNWRSDALLKFLQNLLKDGMVSAILLPKVQWTWCCLMTMQPPWECSQCLISLVLDFQVNH